MDNDRPISSFRNEYQFLSNFFWCLIELDGLKYQSVENAYQASKTLLVAERVQFVYATPRQAKRLGKKITLREDWDIVKIDVMRGLLRKKFSQPHLRRFLLETGDRELIEGNFWGDRFWGESPLGVGENHLGKLLMEIRAEIKAEIKRELGQ